MKPGEEGALTDPTKLVPASEAEPTPRLSGNAVGRAGEPPTCPHAKDTEMASEWLAGWREGYSRWQEADRRYRFGAP